MGPEAPMSEEKFALTTSRNFESWLRQAGGSIAFSTYQAGKLFLLGLRADGKLGIFERTFARSMGIAVSSDARQLLLATHYQLHRLDNALPVGGASGDHDALYVPRLSWVTGDLDIHDLGFGSDGRPLFVNTLFSCLATVSDGYSFKPLWRPAFVSKLAPEDRCHLNGLALQGGVPRFVSAVSASDVADGWRDRRLSGGLVIDVGSGEIVCEGLAMPHSPRLHEGRLWLLNSGTGELGTVDRDAHSFEPVAFCPGFTRGLAFAGRHAIVGLSQARENRTFKDLPLEAELSRRGATARCGLMVIDTANGDAIAWVRIEGVVRELYDVAVIPGVRNPSLLGFKSDEILRVIAIDGG
jgi:uncharacterized protein (TIGR03032 family)